MEVTPMATSKTQGRLWSASCVNVASKHPARAPVGNRAYGTISAKYKGPGPGKYGRQPCTGIKDHDFTKYAEPAYTMRVKSSERIISILESPGPCYFVDPSISHLGIWKPASFRMAAERKKTPGPHGTPAPNEYYVEKIHPPDEPNAPAYTMGHRTQYWESSPHPGPNHYTLPETLGPRLPINISAPCLTMGSNACVWGYATDRVKGPGPAMHSRPEPNVYLHRQPAYSLYQRLPPSSKDYIPGPPDYNAEEVVVHKPRAPRFSLGIRHSDYITSTPTMCIIKE
ncbi:outer dense fiber protein 3-like protein 1 [Hemicordylus capensis]|uniref:outer dense fiber protein 3-like protein 1 n=1 Tax=Hemicordylus capensis TaxID=884348 RepID=UPI002302A16C|nr:outer dense fiber protein 3-like protein 1 [Hemicordylus capensis]XP_053127810.1 outer dense fiber protein 3-like protein 1 [Hemicordylus capensis]